jgi:hypothetical protein
MRCAVCGTELQGQPTHCPRCGTPLSYDQGASGQAPTNPSGAWQGGQAQYPGYGAAYPQQPQGPSFGSAAPPSMPYGAYAPPSTPYGPGAPYGTGAPPSTPYGPGAPYGAGAPPNMPPASGQGYQGPYQQGYGQPGQQPPPGWGVGAPATTPFAPPPAPKRRANPLLIVLSIVGIVVLIAAIGVGAIYFTRLGGSTSTSISAGSATSTPKPTNTPGPTVIYQNSMTTPDSGWPNDQDCFFRSDGYHIVSGTLCFAPVADQKSVDIKVDMNVLSGALGSPHGIILRHDKPSEYYEFAVDPYGHWVFFRCLATDTTCTKLVDYTANSAIHGGLHTVNTLEVSAVGSVFTFFVNGTQVGTANDSMLTFGAVGLAGDDNSEVVFTNVKITQPAQ